MFGCMGACVLIALVLYILFEHWQYIVIVAVIVIVSIIAAAVDDSKKLKDIQYAAIIGRTKVIKTKSRPSGYSISSSGNFRGYWRFRDEVDHIDVKFEVHYESGEVRCVTAMEGSFLYNGLMPYVGIKPKSPIPTPEPPIQNAAPPKPAVIHPKSEPIEIERPMPEAKPTEVPKPRKKEERRFVEVPFEIAPNEYNLTLSYPSCQMVRRSDGECRVQVRFSVSYDPTVKGVRNRAVTCATVDGSGRITAVRRDNKVLDLSGIRIVDIMFWENAEEEPKKVIIGIDRYY